ncbi:MAG TPA: hypothetical protein PKM88_14675, partial [bacterium]|nr:hypothetical protein [bacterium]
MAMDALATALHQAWPAAGRHFNYYRTRLRARWPRTRIVKAALPVLAVAWLVTRAVSDGFMFHALGMGVVALAALHMRKERALLVAMAVSMASRRL